MTLLNNSCPLNMALAPLRKAQQFFDKNFYNSSELPIITNMNSSFSANFYKDTDCLDCFNGHVECYCAHASAFAILVLQDVSPNYHARHAKDLLQLLPAHFVVKLKAQEQFQRRLQAVILFDEIYSCARTSHISLCRNKQHMTLHGKSLFVSH